MKTLCTSILLLFLFLGVQSRAQITATGECSASPVSSTQTDVLDSIFVYQAGVGGTLIATPPGGTGPWDFEWQVFVPGFNGWTSYYSDDGVSSSTISGLAPGGYRVTIYDAGGNAVGCYISWVSEIIGSPGGVDILPIEPSCTTIDLIGVITPTAVTPIYEVGPTPLIIDANTQITICFTGNHTWVSDLAFYLVGPPSCGSPTVLLSPNPGAIGQGPVCNSGNNINNLCFSTESTNNLNICAASTPLTGTYGSYGPSSTPINWSTIYGCEATAGGWAVQIYDCIGLDVGALTDATLTFNGVNLCGQPEIISYSTPPGFSSVINDNSCSASTASIFQVTSSTADPVPQGDCWFEWNAEPWVYIADSTTSLNINLTAPTDSTIFSLDYMCDFDGDGIADLIVEGGGNSCGGVNSATEPFVPIPPLQPFLYGPTSLCQQSGLVTYTSSITVGEWSGPGVDAGGNFDPYNVSGTVVLTFTPVEECYMPASISVTVNPVTQQYTSYDLGEWCEQDAPFVISYCDFMGWCWPIDLGVPGTYLEGQTVMFDPAIAGPGTYTWTEVYQGMCTYLEADNEITVIAQPTPGIVAPDWVCELDPVQDLGVDLSGGTWGGTGIENATTGLFNPGLVGGGNVATVSYALAGQCPITVFADIEIIAAPDPVITAPDTLCVGAGVVGLSVNETGGTWSGVGVVDTQSGLFDPALAGVGQHEVEYEVDNGCVVVDEISILVVPNFDATIAQAGPFCITEAPLLLSAANGGGVWGGNGIADSILGQFDPGAAGAGSSMITYMIGGVCGDTDQISVEVEEVPVLAIDDPGPLCANAPNIDLSTNLPGGEWDGPGVNIATGEFSPASTGDGLWTIGYFVDGVCDVSAEIEIEVLTLPTINLPDEVTTCAGDSVLVTANGSYDALSWQDGQSVPDIWLTQEGVYGVTAFLGACSESDQVQLNVINIPEIDLGSDLVLCQGQQALIEAPLPGVWSTGDSGNSVVVSSTGTLFFTYPNNGCPAYDTIHVEFLSYPVVDLGSDRYICPEASAVLSSGMSGEWSTGDTLTYIEVSEAGQYFFTVANGPCVTVDSVSVYILPLPVADLGEDLVGCDGEPLVLFAGHPANNNYEWSTGEEADWIYVSSNGTYGVYTSNTCGETYDEIEVNFVDCTPSVYIPNTFTPDGDGVNDVWKPVTYKLTSYELLVYDRWGIRVFHSTNPDEYWTGNFDGGEYFVPDGVYVYLLKYETEDLDAQRVRGHVTVVR